MPTFPQITSPPQASAEVLVNRMGETVSGIAAYGKKQSTTTGLTWGGYGCDKYLGNVIADWTVALTDNATNYIVVLRSTGVASVSTSTTNGANPLYAKLYKVTTSGGVVTAVEDQRFDSNGLFQGSGASGLSLVDQFCVFIAAPANKSYTIVIDCKFACVINEVTTQSASGTCTLTTKINSTALGGTANSVSSSETTQTHSSANSVAAGDNVVLTVSSNSSCADMSVTIKYTRTLA